MIVMTFVKIFKMVRQVEYDQRERRVKTAIDPYAFECIRLHSVLKTCIEIEVGQY